MVAMMTAALSANEILAKTYVIFDNEEVRLSPAKKEFTVEHSRIAKALLSFDLDLRGSLGARLDIASAITINDNIVEGISLPDKKKKKSLSNIKREDIDVTKLVKSSLAGEKNTIEVSYLTPILSMIKSKMSPLGTLTVSLKVFVPIRYCMWDGKAIGIDETACPYCKQSPPSGGVDPIQCGRCKLYLPPQSKFCEQCGADLSTQLAKIKICVLCNSVIADNAIFCQKCGKRQPEEKRA